jgi:hypothetical protein
MSEPVRPIADQRRLLVATIRSAADWRAGRADTFEHDKSAHRENKRAKTALRTLANFGERLSDDDRDLELHALRRADERDGRLQLTDDSMALLSRFGINRGSWRDTRPTESQMRNILRRVDGIESKERRARRERAEAGYGDD